MARNRAGASGNGAECTTASCRSRDGSGVPCRDVPECANRGAFLEVFNVVYVRTKADNAHVSLIIDKGHDSSTLPPPAAAVVPTAAGASHNGGVSARAAASSLLHAWQGDF